MSHQLSERTPSSFLSFSAFAHSRPFIHFLESGTTTSASFTASALAVTTRGVTFLLRKIEFLHLNLDSIHLSPLYPLEGPNQGCLCAAGRTHSGHTQDTLQA